MSTHYSLDRESFENFLANAVAVQKSGLDTRSLSAIIEIQQFMACDEFDLDRLMQMIADRVLQLFNASGTAIALLDSNELVYRAGAGNAAKELGRRVAAVLNVCSSHDVRKEILRVENADTDTRVEAEICRQFGAISLLMLAICENCSLVGVLEVRFDHAHSFTHREIHVCRLMVGTLEEGMVRRPHRTEDQEATGANEQIDYAQVSSPRDPAERAVNPSSISSDAVEQNASPGQNLTNKGGFFSYRAVVIREIDSLGTSLRTALSSTANTTGNANSWFVGAVLTAAALLGIITWVSNVTHPSALTKGLSVPTQLDTGQSVPAKPLVPNDKSDPLTNGHHERTKGRPGFRRLQIGPNEVDYIAEDVTIRQFTITPTKPQLRSGVKEVNFGDNVTVRHFAEAAPLAPQLPSTLQIKPSTKRSVSPPQ